MEQFTEADHLAVMLFAVKEGRSWQKGMPADVGGLIPPLYVFELIEKRKHDLLLQF